MRLKCLDGQYRDFTPLSDLFIAKGFDPCFLDEDKGLVQIDLPPNVSFFDAISLSKAGLEIKSYFKHWSRRHKKANPISVSVDDVAAEIEWIAVHSSLKYLRDDDLRLRMDLFTSISRLFINIWDFFALNYAKSYTLDGLWPGINREEYPYFVGHKLHGFLYSFDFRENRLCLEGEDQKLYEVCGSLLGHTKHIYVCLKSKD